MKSEEQKWGEVKVMKMCQVEILPWGKQVEAEPGSNLLNLLQREGYAPDAPCGGHGTCKKCMVNIADKDGRRRVQACQTLVTDQLRVYPEETKPMQILSEGVEERTVMDPVRPGALLAVDIGTTTVVAYLLDGEDGHELFSASMLNPQTSYGADVISRIQAALRGQMEELTACIREGLTGLILKVCQRADMDPAGIGVLSVVGNPCMQQLFLGIRPDNLAAVPFVPVLTEAKIVPAAPYLPILSRAALLLVPDIGGYVGADTVGCALATRLYDRRDVTLLIDIGTNGEMILGNQDRMAACSTAAGPALEGAGIRFGMRGTAGAVDHVWEEDGQIRYSVIGGKKAVGICGSGLLDAAAVMLDMGIINERGRIRMAKELPSFGRYLSEVNEERVFFLTDEVFLTQQDIRSLQAAKGAIRAGIELLAQHLEIRTEEIKEVLLAGAFGTFLNPDSAVRIGLIPPALKGKIRAVGNAAGSGAKLMALSREAFLRGQRIAKTTEFVELAALEGFQRCFAVSMRF